MTKVLSLLIGILFSLQIFGQSDLIISEYVEGWGTNKAIEVYNPTSEAINLIGYQLVRYANGEDVPPAADDWLIGLPDISLEPYRTFVCVLDKRDPNGTGQEAPIWEQLQDRADVFLCANYSESNTLYHNGNDAIALEKTDGTLIDLFGRWGAPAPADAAIPGSDRTAECWTDTAPYFTGEGIGITADHTLYRKADIINGVTENPAMFNPLGEWDSLSANTFNHLGWHVSSVTPDNATPTFGKESFEFTISKNASEGKALGTVTANDAEDDKLNFFINAGNFIYNENDERKTPFKMNRATGEITLVDPGSLSESQWDTIYMEVSVNDGFTESGSISVLAILAEWPVSTNDLAGADFDFYPNPVSNGTLRINATKEISQVRIMDISGRIANSFDGSGRIAVLNIENLNKGAYLVKVNYSDHTSTTKRFVKQ